MPKIVWDAVGEKKYESGVDHAVLYTLSETGEYKPGVPWNGVTGISETPEGAEPESQYADNIKYLTIVSAEELNGTIEAFQSPKEFDACDGNIEIAPGVTIGQQDRKTFGLTYRTLLGDDVKGQEAGYKLHLLYGATASPSERSYETINDSPEAMALSWDYSTTPVPVSGHKPTALMTIDSTRVSAEALARLEAVLYGSDADGEDAADSEPRLPLPDEVIAILGNDAAAASYARSRSMVQDY